MKTILSILVLLSVLSIAAAPADLIPGAAYIPHSVAITYNLYSIVAHVVQISTGQVLGSIGGNIYDFRVDLLQAPVPITVNVPQTSNPSEGTCGAIDGIPLYVAWDQSPGSPNFSCGQTLQTSYGYQWDGVQRSPYLGEMINQFGYVTMPPEPEMSLMPFTGQVYDIHSTVYKSVSDATVLNGDYRTTMYTLAHVSSWRGIPDVWITVLDERNTASGSDDVLYEYVWARGIGVIDLWTGPMGANGIIYGTEYIMVSHNP